ncbi:unnamed protein product [Haemonchus placei]|uniref:CTNNB1_binding domain-containing protein n=1 Tax=Haemonchus placei TaxID=6290 RepID=A0A0N4W847_HAEPC|nr:unnamed protein product [Haemonchus placei]
MDDDASSVNGQASPSGDEWCSGSPFVSASSNYQKTTSPGEQSDGGSPRDVNQEQVLSLEDKNAAASPSHESASAASSPAYGDHGDDTKEIDAKSDAEENSTEGEPKGTVSSDEEGDSGESRKRRAIDSDDSDNEVSSPRRSICLSLSVA